MSRDKECSSRKRWWNEYHQNTSYTILKQLIKNMYKKEVGNEGCFFIAALSLGPGDQSHKSQRKQTYECSREPQKGKSLRMGLLQTLTSRLMSKVSMYGAEFKSTLWDGQICKSHDDYWVVFG